jgi:uncharacterized membrane protein
MMGWGYMGPAGWFVMVLGWLFVLAGLLLGAWALVTVLDRGTGCVRSEASPQEPSPHTLPRTPPQTPPQSVPQSALQTPAEVEVQLRYARGQIDAETLARQLAVLRGR